MRVSPGQEPARLRPAPLRHHRLWHGFPGLDSTRKRNAAPAAHPRQEVVGPRSNRVHQRGHISRAQSRRGAQQDQHQQNRRVDEAGCEGARQLTGRAGKRMGKGHLGTWTWRQAGTGGKERPGFCHERGPRCRAYGCGAVTPSPSSTRRADSLFACCERLLFSSCGKGLQDRDFQLNAVRSKAHFSATFVDRYAYTD
jgi:hypothetical protein